MIDAFGQENYEGKIKIDIFYTKIHTEKLFTIDRNAQYKISYTETEEYLQNVFDLKRFGVLYKNIEIIIIILTYKHEKTNWNEFLSRSQLGEVL